MNSLATTPFSTFVELFWKYESMILMTMLVLVFAQIMIRYLSRETSVSRTEIRQQKDLLMTLLNTQVDNPEIVTTRIQNLEQKIEELTTARPTLTKEEQTELVDEIKNRANDQAVKEIIGDIQARASLVIQKRNDIKLIEFHYTSTIDRLRDELFALSKRSNLNLVIGIVTTLTGLLLLGMLVLTPSTTHIPQSMENFLIGFIPRISLVLLIEVFAYFFLRLYRGNLAEIKYFQNEITTIEAKYLALKIAVNYDEPDSLKGVIEKLSSMERNFILEKGQSTVDLEKSKLESKATTDVLGQITSLLKNKG